MSRTWILDVLDRELPDMLGARRDQLADAILAAIPLEPIAAAITTSALATLLVGNVIGHDRRRYELAHDIGNQAAMGVVERLSETEDEEQEGARVQ